MNDHYIYKWDDKGREIYGKSPFGFEYSMEWDDKGNVRYSNNQGLDAWYDNEGNIIKTNP